jgi:hypothetical protein
MSRHKKHWNPSLVGCVWQIHQGEIEKSIPKSYIYIKMNNDEIYIEIKCDAFGKFDYIIKKV